MSDNDPIVIPRCRCIYASGHMSLERGIWASVCVLDSKARHPRSSLDVQVEFGAAFTTSVWLSADSARKYGAALVAAADALDDDEANKKETE